MPELNIDFDFFEHPKTMMLCARLGEWAEILPIRLWRFAGRFHAETGILSTKSLDVLELHLKWRGEKGEAIESLIEAGFLEPTESGYAVHDFLKRNGHIAALSKRGKSAAKSRWDRVNKPPESEPCKTDAQALLNHATGNALTGRTNETSETYDTNETRARASPKPKAANSSNVEKIAADLAQRFWFKQTGGKESEFKIAEAIGSMLTFGYDAAEIATEIDKSATARDWSERFFKVKDKIEKASNRGQHGKPSGHLGAGRIAVDQAALDQNARRRADQAARSAGASGQAIPAEPGSRAGEDSS